MYANASCEIMVTLLNEQKKKKKWSNMVSLALNFLGNFARVRLFKVVQRTNSPLKIHSFCFYNTLGPNIFPVKLIRQNYSKQPTTYFDNSLLFRSWNIKRRQCLKYNIWISFQHVDFFIKQTMARNRENRQTLKFKTSFLHSLFCVSAWFASSCFVWIANLPFYCRRWLCLRDLKRIFLAIGMLMTRNN